jgi:hypothetical protein
MPKRSRRPGGIGALGGSGAAREQSHIARRAWLLLLLDGVEHAGASPIASTRLHRLAFLANCLAPVYDLPSPDGKIVKYRRGPFYPDLQWDVDRLVAQNLVSMRNLEHVRDVAGLWFRADYELSDAGVTAVHKLTDSPRAERGHGFLRELAAAYAALPEGAREDAALSDATFTDPLVNLGSLIDFAEWDVRNFTHQTADAFADFVPPAVHLTPRDKLHLYFRYLDRMVERAAG